MTGHELIMDLLLLTCTMGTINAAASYIIYIIFDTNQKSSINILTHYRKRVETRLLTFDKIDHDY